jgi:hypothetical protein
VDDVIIMTNANLSEWTKIHKIINTFCIVSGMMINYQKSNFLVTGVGDATLDELKSLYNIESIDLSEGFNYLGFYIKPTSYKAEDWR